ncbi:MAG: DUF4367 domain-containing protein [Clostridia bacterium]|nr:DUF4367 domain-containing protein [Clostridia bacterium]
MMNRNEKLEIAKRLRHSEEMEMSRDDLALILEAELSKPEAEMDTELVQQILELLEEAPSQAKQHEAWQKISKRLKIKQWQPVVSGLTRIAAVGVILVAIMFATYGTAQALNWEFLLRWMKPFAETFMIYSGDKPEPTPEPMTSEVYSDVGRAFTQEEFATLADCPDKVEGYPAKPVWMPERFTYLQGSLYSDPLMTCITHVFRSDSGNCIIDISMLEDGNQSDTYQFEQLPAENVSMYVAGYQITFYNNTDNAMQSASLVAENTTYFITGPISEEEIISILESMMK